MSTHDVKPTTVYRPNKLPASSRFGRAVQIPEDFADIVADHRSIGRTDDDIALSFGITTETLHGRFRRFGIPQGRRWRDIEDQRPDNVLRKVEARRITANDGGDILLPGTNLHRRRAS